MAQARTLTELLPADVPAERQRDAIVEEINKMTLLVATDLQRARVIPEIAWTDRKKQFSEDFQQKLVTREHTAHVILNYFYLYEHDTIGFRDSVIGFLDQGIGVYETHRSAAIRRKFNPVSWLGFVVSIPVRVLMAAGLLSKERDSEGAALKVLLTALQTAWLGTITYIGTIAAKRDWLERILKTLGG